MTVTPIEEGCIRDGRKIKRVLKRKEEAASGVSVIIFISESISTL